jgi:hypothetical protein
MTDARLIANTSYLAWESGRSEIERYGGSTRNSRVREEPGTRDQAHLNMKPTAMTRGEQAGERGRRDATYEKPPSSMSLRAFVLVSFSSWTAISSCCGGGCPASGFACMSLCGRSREVIKKVGTVLSRFYRSNAGSSEEMMVRKVGKRRRPRSKESFISYRSEG